MALKNIFNSMKREGYIIKDLDLYLLSLNSEDNDRAIDVNAPSQIGKCLRARYYARAGVPADTNAIDSRTRRIFDNGTGVHVRLQDYLKKQGMLLMDEVPLINEEYNIQGHTDGLLQLTPSEKGILEIKSMNSRSFSELKIQKPEHTMQGLVYVYCSEQRRLYLKETYEDEKAFKKSILTRRKWYASHYQHLKDGHKFTREQKIGFQVKLHEQMDDILFHTDNPITKVVFLYENKDTQELKEFTVCSTDSSSENILKSIQNDCIFLNNCVGNDTVPPRCEGCTSRSCNVARFCNYKLECFN